MFNIFKARRNRGIGGCLLMACLEHVSSLKSKLKSTWNYT